MRHMTLGITGCSAFLAERVRGGWDWSVRGCCRLVLWGYVIFLEEWADWNLTVSHLRWSWRVVWSHLPIFSVWAHCREWCRCVVCSERWSYWDRHISLKVFGGDCGTARRCGSLCIEPWLCRAYWFCIEMGVTFFFLWSAFYPYGIPWRLYIWCVINGSKFHFVPQRRTSVPSWEVCIVPLVVHCNFLVGTLSCFPLNLSNIIIKVQESFQD